MTTPWNSPQIAPRDGTQILADFNYPWPVIAAWNDHDERWATATMQACEMIEGKTDIWFETERENHKDLKGWLELPEIPKHK